MRQRGSSGAAAGGAAAAAGGAQGDGAAGLKAGARPRATTHSTPTPPLPQVESVRPGDKAVFTGMLVVVPDVAALT